MPLYKYMQKKHLENFFSKGRIKIGTLYEYRKIETYGHVIGDEREGVHFTELSIPGGGDVDLTRVSRESSFLSHIFKIAPGARGSFKIRLGEGTTFINTSNSPDFFIYCTTTDYDPVVMKQFGYNACMEIVNPAAFFNAISRAIRHKAVVNGHGPIQYRDRSTHYTEPHTVHPAMMKSLEYAHQQEERTIWSPMKKLLRPLFIDVPGAVKYCRRFEP